jgi:hypothetical protein
MNCLPALRIPRIDFRSWPRPSTASVSTLQASTPAGTNAEMVYFDVTPATLTRWQHRDKSLVSDTPEDRSVRDPNPLSKRWLTSI